VLRAKIKPYSKLKEDLKNLKNTISWTCYYTMGIWKIEKIWKDLWYLDDEETRKANR